MQVPRAVPTTIAETEELTPDFEEDLWHPEVMQAQMADPQGIKRIGTDESWLELAWNLHHRLAFLTLYTAEGETPIKHRAQNQRSGKTQANSEMALIREIHAYWLSHLSSVDQLYEYIYKNPHGAYKNLHWVNLEQFGRLCAMVDWLYVYFNEDFDKLAEYVGNAESVAEFMQETQTLIDSTVTDRDVFVQRADKMWREKREWQETTAQLAQEILGR